VPDPKPYKPPYQFSVTIGETCNRKMRNFVGLAEKLKMPVEDLMRQANGHASPSKALVKGLARELEINESYLDKLADGSEGSGLGQQRLRRAGAGAILGCHRGNWVRCTNVTTWSILGSK
jgi:hypothetical protein